MKNNIVSIYEDLNIEYPTKNNCFRPNVKFCECPYEEISEEKNTVYEAVRNAFVLLDLDKKNFGTKEWNPFGDFIKKNDTVLIKPNMVFDYNKNEKYGTNCLYTHPSVLAPIIDYAVIALGNTGKIIVGDAPMQECNFEKLIEDSGYDRLINFYKEKGINIELVDFRGVKSCVKDWVHYYEETNDRGTLIDLGNNSAFASRPSKYLKKMRVTNYDPREMSKHHNEYHNEYKISNDLLDANVIINVPKPKTHRKAGVTISLKNMIGTNTRKEYLPHHTKGAKSKYSDEYEKTNLLHSTRSLIQDVRNVFEAKKKVRIVKVLIKSIGIISKFMRFSPSEYDEGNWYGNDTISKTVVDVNKIITYADKYGQLTDTPQRKQFIVADMVYSGEGEGPLAPKEKKVGIIAAGFNSVCFDECIAELMGMDIKKIPTLLTARKYNNTFRLVDPDGIGKVISNNNYYERIGVDFKREWSKKFEPSSGWKNHIEKFD